MAQARKRLEVPAFWGNRQVVSPAESSAPLAAWTCVADLARSDNPEASVEHLSLAQRS